MDLKFRLSKPQDNSKEQSSKQKLSNNLNVSNNLNKYAKKNNLMEDKQQNKQRQQKKSSLDKYYKRQSAPKTQFKQYLTDTQNVFYEDRTLLKQKLYLAKLNKIFIFTWFFLAISYFFIQRINPYDGFCPANAKCSVFITCERGYQLNQNSLCVIDRKIIHKATQISLMNIEQLKYQLGNSQCQGIHQTSINKRIDQMYPQGYEAEDQKTKTEILSFLMNKNNQKQYNYQVIHETVIRTSQKKFRLGCLMKLHMQTNQFIVQVAITVTILITITIIVTKVKRKGKVEQIYKQLKQKLIREQTLNISYEKEDLQKKYGLINQKLWKQIDQLRTNDQKIGYFQDDFLYWKLL